MRNPGIRDRRANPIKTNGCLNNVENERDKTVPTEKTGMTKTSKIKNIAVGYLMYKHAIDSYTTDYITQEKPTGNTCLYSQGYN